jgi:O-antigen/teichoic acid export membrane protein
VAPTYAGVLGAGFFRGGSTIATVAVYGVVLWVTPFLLQYIFNGLYQTRWVAAGSAARGVVFLAAVVLFARPDSTPVVVALAEVLGATAMALVHWIGARRVLPSAGAGAPAPLEPRAILARSWRIGASELVWGLQWYVGLVWLGYAAASEDVAWHSAALRIVTALHTGVYLYLYVLLPTLARLLAHDRAAWRDTVEDSLRLTAWAGLAIALGGTLVAEPILRTAFGAPFAAGTDALRLLVWIVPIAWWSGHIRYSLIGAGRPELDYRAALAGTSVTIALTLTLVPSLHATGAAAALTAGMIANGLTAWHYGRRHLPSCRFLSPLAPGAIACLASAGLAWTIAPRFGNLWSGALSFALFGAIAAFAVHDRVRIHLFGDRRPPPAN